MKLMPTRFKPLASCHCPSYEAGTFSCVVTRVDAFAGVHLVSILGGQGLISSCPAIKDCHRLKVNNGATFFTRFSINYWQTSTETQPKSFSNHNSSNFCLEASLATRPVGLQGILHVFNEGKLGCKELNLTSCESVSPRSKVVCKFGSNDHQMVKPIC